MRLQEEKRKPRAIAMTEEEWEQTKANTIASDLESCGDYVRRLIRADSKRLQEIKADDAAIDRALRTPR